MLLYLHNGKRNAFINDVLNGTNAFGWQGCELLGWDILDTTYHDYLQDILNENIANTDELTHKIIRIDKESCLFILIPSSCNPFFSIIKRLDDSNVRLQISLAKDTVKENVRKSTFLKNTYDILNELIRRY